MQFIYALYFSQFTQICEQAMFSNIANLNKKLVVDLFEVQYASKEAGLSLLPSLRPKPTPRPLETRLHTFIR